MTIKEMRKEYESLLDSYNSAVDVYEKRLKIDIYNLEKECAEHSDIYYRVALFQSDIRAQAGNCSLLVKEMESQLSIDIRNNPDSFGIVKLTESAILETINVDQDIIEVRRLKNAFDELNDQRYQL